MMKFFWRKMGILPKLGNLPTLPAHFLAHIEPLLLHHQECGICCNCCMMIINLSKQVTVLAKLQSAAVEENSELKYHTRGGRQAKFKSPNSIKMSD